MATLNGRPLKSLKVADLKEELAERGLAQSGKKQDLIERLEQYILEHEIEDIDETAGETSKNSSNQEESGEIPPTVQIDTNLEENDIIKEYMMMRQSQFQSTMEEVKQVKAAVSPSSTATSVSDKKESPAKVKPATNVQKSVSGIIWSQGKIYSRIVSYQGKQ